MKRLFVLSVLLFSFIGYADVTKNSAYYKGNLRVDGIVGFGGAAQSTIPLSIFTTANSPEILRFAADSDSTNIVLRKSRNATVGAHTIVQSNDNLGSLVYTGSDGTNYQIAARINAEVDGTPGSGDMPGRLVFFTTSDGSSTPVERMRISQHGGIGIGGNSVSGTPLTVRNAGTVLARFAEYSADANGGLVQIYKSRGATVGTETIVQSGDQLGRLTFNGIDGTNPVIGGEIRVEVDGTPGSADMPGRMLFMTTPDGSSTPLERLRIGANGDIGINGVGVTGTPLTISSLNTEFIRARTYSNDANSGLIHLFKSRGTTVGTETIVQSGDRLGRISFNGSDGVAPVRGAEIYSEVDGTPGSNDMPGRLIFATSPDGSGTPVERLRIDSVGNIGIGISPNASAKLHINGTDPTIRITNEDTTLVGDQLIGSLDFDKTDGSGAGTGVTASVRSVSDGSIGEASRLAFHTGDSTTNNVERLRLTSGGSLLQLNNTTANVLFRTITDDNSAVLELARSSTENGGERYLTFRETATSGVSPGALAGGIQRNAGDTAYEFFNASDARLKQDIVDWDGDALDAINHLKVRKYRWIATPEREVVGFVAQEIKPYIPDMVTGNEETEMLNVGYSALYHYLVKAIQQLSEKNNTLEARINDLEARLVALENP